MTEEEEEEKQKRIHSIKNLYAFELFCQHRFDDSMQIFVKLGTGKEYTLNLWILKGDKIDKEVLFGMID